MSYLEFSVTDRGHTGARSHVAGEARVLEFESGLSVPEIARLARSFARSGVTRVQLAGGEPLLREEVVAIVETFAHQRGIAVVAMTTDGVELARCAEPLLWAGLQRITITLDSLDRGTYRSITGHDSLPKVLAGLEAARRLPFQHVCVSMVVMAGCNEAELPAFVELARTGLAVRFVELTPVTGRESEWAARFVPAAEIRRRMHGLDVRVGPEGAGRHTFPGGGSVEVAAPVSEPTAGRWIRLRISATGRLTSCEQEAYGEDLRPWLATPELDARVEEAVQRVAG